jgi:transposase InsO family protein
MPWKESSVIEERLRFVVLASRPGANVAELCREFGVSRQTGYTWKKRFHEGGTSQITDRSRRPLHSPTRTAASWEERIVEMRRQWPDWGAPKLHYLLCQRWPGVVPALRTVHRVLDRHGLVHPADRPTPTAWQRFERSQPNQLWQMDFKGPQGFNPGIPVGPLSVQDDHSRYLVALQRLGSTKAVGVQTTLERVFGEVGQPDAMLMDHGTPWWNAASPWGLTELAVWIMERGVQLVFSGLRHPQTQGKVERMHGALQRAVRRRKADPEDQAWLDAFRHEYNHLRPHQALSMATPSTRWQPSHLCFQSQPAEWIYPAHMTAVRLHTQGQLHWGGRRWEISNALRGRTVALERIGERAIVYYCNTPVRELDLIAKQAVPIRLDFHRSLQG